MAVSTFGETSLGLETGVIFVSGEVNLDLETGVVLAGFKVNGFLTSGLGVVLAIVFLFPQYFQNCPGLVIPLSIAFLSNL